LFGQYDSGAGYDFLTRVSNLSSKLTIPRLTTTDGKQGQIYCQDDQN